MFTVTTNHHIRPLLAVYELAPNEITTFGLEYIEEEESYSSRLFRYRGWVYDINEFTRICKQSAQLHDPLAYNSFATRVEDDSPLVGWDGEQSDSFFSGIVVKLVTDIFGDEGVIVGSYYAS
jgi:hypothetical protein